MVDKIKNYEVLQRVKKLTLIETKSFYVCLFLIGLIILFFRSAYIFMTPYMYTEDGMWISSIYKFGFLHTLFHAKAQYFVFGNIILLQISNLLNTFLFGDNLTLLPIMIAIVSYVFYSFSALLPIICFKKILNFSSRFIIWVLILLMPLGDTASEIFGKISNIGYMFYFIAFCLLVLRQVNSNSSSKYFFVILDLFIIICPLTNPACYPLVLSGFLFSCFVEIKNRNKFSNENLLKVIFSKFYMKIWICTLIILCIFLLVNIKLGFFPNNGGVPYSAIPWNNKEKMIEFFVRSELYPFIFSIYQNLNFTISSILLIIVNTIIILSIIFIKNIKYKSFIISSYFSCIILIFFTLFSRSGLVDMLSNYTTTFPDRYYYCQNILGLVSITSAITCILYSKKSVFKKTINYFFIFGLIMLNISNRNHIFEFYDSRYITASTTFKNRIENAYQYGECNNGYYTVQIEFQGWTMNIPENKIIETVNQKK